MLRGSGASAGRLLDTKPSFSTHTSLYLRAMRAPYCGPSLDKGRATFVELKASLVAADMPRRISFENG
jgi:hypothetical protein